MDLLHTVAVMELVHSYVVSTVSTVELLYLIFSSDRWQLCHWG